MAGFNNETYIPVSERLAAAAENILSITIEAPVMLTETMGYMRAVVQFKDGRLTTGTASFRLDLAGRSAQATNPIEDCETSAVGRALAMAGYEVQRGVASREEVAEAQRRAEATPAARPCPKCGAEMVPGKNDPNRYYCRPCWQASKEAAR